MQLPLARLGGRVVVELLRRSGHDLGRDAESIMRVLDGLPDGSARTAFTRTLRSVVDWRGQVVTMLDRCYLAEAMPTCSSGATTTASSRSGTRTWPTRRCRAAGSRSSPGAGHFPHHHDPDRFVALLDDFIDTTEPADHDPGRLRELLRQGRPRPRRVWLDEDEVVALAVDRPARTREQVPAADDGDGDLLPATGT